MGISDLKQVHPSKPQASCFGQFKRSDAPTGISPRLVLRNLCQLADISMAMREKRNAGRRNWELLVRSLLLKKFHELDDISIKLPLKIRDHRWLFEEARAHDVAGLEENLMGRIEDPRWQRCHPCGLQALILKESLVLVHLVADKVMRSYFNDS